MLPTVTALLVRSKLAVLGEKNIREVLENAVRAKLFFRVCAVFAAVDCFWLLTPSCYTFWPLLSLSFTFIFLIFITFTGFFVLEVGN
jgi:hypothetical protein